MFEIFNSATGAESSYLEQEEVRTEETSETTEEEAAETGEGTEQEEGAVPPSDAEQGEESEETEEAAGESEQAAFDYQKAYRELQRDYTKKAQELAALKKSANNPPPEPEAVEQFWEEMQRDPRGAIERVAMAKAQEMVAPFWQAEAEKNYGVNLQAVAKEYPAVQTEEGYAKFAAAVKEMAAAWGAPHLLYNPPPELLDAAAKKTFGPGPGRLYQQGREKGRQEALDNLRSKQGLAANTIKPKKEQKTPEEAYAESIMAAGRRRGIFG